MTVGIDVAGTGFTVLDRLYAGEDRAGEALGGSCGNVLVSLAMLSRSVTPVLTLGRDWAGDYLVREFADAGADTRYISRRADVASPILAQRLNLESGHHWFSFICPETKAELPRYTSIEAADVSHAHDVISRCSVFYSDRVSDTIVEAMESAAEAGALIYFEPSSIENDKLFERALKVSRILKYSSDCLADRISASDLSANAISIVTHGASGLELRQGDVRIWCEAMPATIVRDTCGSGDMVSVGVIDWILDRSNLAAPDWTLTSLLGGVVAGQRLAAANCAFAGPRGLFQRFGAAMARQVLDGAVVASLTQLTSSATSVESVATQPPRGCVGL